MVALVMVDFRQDSVIVIGVKQSQIFWSQSKKAFRSIDSRKIAQDNRGVLVGLRAALSFVVQEEESLVFRNRASQVETILVLLQARIGHIQHISPVQRLIHAEIISRSMVVVGA